MKFGLPVAPQDLIKMFNFCNKIFKGFTSTGSQNPRFSTDLLVIVTTVLRDHAAPAHGFDTPLLLPMDGFTSN